MKFPFVRSLLATLFLAAHVAHAPDEASADALVESMHPIGYGQPSDVASAVLYLASDAARWTTGAELVIDGGATAT